MRIATWAKERNISTHYYISPQIWAWKENRIKTIKRDVDFMYVILPFEKDFTRKHNFPVHFVGHPLIDAISSRTEVSDEVLERKNQLSEKPIIIIITGKPQTKLLKCFRLCFRLKRFSRLSVCNCWCSKSGI